MIGELRVHLLPQLVEPADLRDRTVVAIDVLRATTTICHALAAGATAVVPCLEIDEARAAAEQLGRAGAVLGGERQGRKIAGFDLGNSPTEYTAASVGGRTVVFTTTNGTRALRHAAAARAILVGAFVNLGAIVERLASCERADLLCAGTNGAVTLEDALFAGAVVDHLTRSAGGVAAGPGLFSVGAIELNDQARLVCDAWRTWAASGASLASALRACQGGRNLIGEGFDADIDTAAALDRFAIVPRFDVASGRITAA